MWRGSGRTQSAGDVVTKRKILVPWPVVPRRSKPKAAEPSLSGLEKVPEPKSLSSLCVWAHGDLPAGTRWRMPLA